MKKRLLIVCLTAGLTVSCTPLSKEIMSQVDKTLTYPIVQQDPDRYKGKAILWGGVIAEITNRQQETILEIRQTELDLEKRPKNLDRSAGRFLAQYGGFLDPAIYKEGREITVAGEVIGSEVLPLKDIRYSYPVIRVKEMHLWEIIQNIGPAYPYYWDYPYWWYGYPWWYRPYYVPRKP